MMPDQALRDRDGEYHERHDTGSLTGQRADVPMIKNVLIAQVVKTQASGCRDRPKENDLGAIWRAGRDRLFAGRRINPGRCVHCRPRVKRLVFLIAP